MSPTPSSALRCPCDRNLPYAGCCGLYHRGPQALQAPDALALMRSRYSAFVLQLPDYLLATWHLSTRPPALVPNEPGLRWLGLQVRAYRPIDFDHAEVEFVARSKLAGRAHRLHERSRFVREHERWYYIDGQFLA